MSTCGAIVDLLLDSEIKLNDWLVAWLLIMAVDIFQQKIT